jgi:hypothetical protein
MEAYKPERNKEKLFIEKSGYVSTFCIWKEI